MPASVPPSSSTTAVKDVLNVLSVVAQIALKATFATHYQIPTAVKRSTGKNRPWPTHHIRRSDFGSRSIRRPLRSDTLRDGTTPAQSSDALVGSGKRSLRPSDIETRENSQHCESSSLPSPVLVDKPCLSEVVNEAGLSSDSTKVGNLPLHTSVPSAPSRYMNPTTETDGTPTEPAESLLDGYDATAAPHIGTMRASRVPSSRIARFLHYGSLGVGLAWGAAGSALSPSLNKPTASDGRTSKFMSQSNIRRLVDKLSTMRGAALKLGQFLSIQEADLLPKEIEEVLRQVQASADYMPEYQLESVMTAELGREWRRHFQIFDVRPFAAASIGQVHHARLSSDHPDHPGMEVAVKVQFPGIEQSIESDLGYLKWLLMASAILPKGLFLDSTIRQMRIELHDECNYSREAEMTRRFRKIFERQAHLSHQVLAFEVPQVIDNMCTNRIITTEMMKGKPLAMVSDADQQARNEVRECDARPF